MFEVARLHWTERVVKNREGCALPMSHIANIGGFAATDKGTGIDRSQLLLNLTDDCRTSALCQCIKFGERIRRGDAMRGTGFNPNQNGAFGLCY